MCVPAVHAFFPVGSTPVTRVDGQFDEPAGGCLGCSWFLNIMNKVAMHVLVQVFVRSFHFLTINT